VSNLLVHPHLGPTRQRPRADRDRPLIHRTLPRQARGPGAPRLGPTPLLSFLTIEFASLVVQLLILSPFSLSTLSLYLSRTEDLLPIYRAAWLSIYALPLSLLFLPPTDPGSRVRRFGGALQRRVGWLVARMSTAVAPGMPPAHGGFQRPGKGKADPDEREREANGFLSSSSEEEGDEAVVRREEEEEEEAVVRREEEEEEEAAGLSDCSSIGAASSDSSSIGENSASEKEDGEEDEVQSKAKEVAGLGMMGLESLEDALPSK
jgi:hypothetical protein